MLERGWLPGLVGLLVALAVGSALQSPPAEASCDVIPLESNVGFRGAIGTLDRPFAFPNDVAAPPPSL